MIPEKFLKSLTGYDGPATLSAIPPGMDAFVLA